MFIDCQGLYSNVQESSLQSDIFSFRKSKTVVLLYSSQLFHPYASFLISWPKKCSHGVWEDVAGPLDVKISPLCTLFTVCTVCTDVNVSAKTHALQCTVGSVIHSAHICALSRMAHCAHCGMPCTLCSALHSGTVVISMQPWDICAFLLGRELHQLLN